MCALVRGAAQNNRPTQPVVIQCGIRTHQVWVGHQIECPPTLYIVIVI